MEIKYHKNAAAGRWFQFSVAEQMANIWSEVGRTLQQKEKNERFSKEAVQRALELFDLTLRDPRWKNKGRIKEIALVREFFYDAISGGKEYGASLEDFDRYFYPFALVARKNLYTHA